MKNDLAQIRRNAKWLCAQTPIFILSDEIRANNIKEIIECAPKNAKIIIRNHRIDEYSHLLALNKNILATISPRLANRHKLFGIHIPNKRLKYFRQSARKNLFVTASAHSGREITKAQNLGIENILISPIFKSKSPSAINTLGSNLLGPIKLAILVRQFPNLNFIALGGINAKTVCRLKNVRIGAIAGVSFRK